MLVVSGVDMATGGNEASFDYGKKSILFLSFFLSLLMVKFFAALCIHYIFKLPLHSFFAKMRPVLDFINLVYFEQT